MSTANSDPRIGTSGWNYPSGNGTWNRIFYPPSRGRAKNFDELSFYAEHFNTVEVNSTFYGQPRAEVARAWASRTPAGFEFSVKLYQKFTHPKMFKARVGRGVPDEAVDPALLEALARPNEADLDAFPPRLDPLPRATYPLASSGRLGALLAQFPASFKDTPASRDYLVNLLGAFGD